MRLDGGGLFAKTEMPSSELWLLFLAVGYHSIAREYMYDPVVEVRVEGRPRSDSAHKTIVEKEVDTRCACPVYWVQNAGLPHG